MLFILMLLSLCFSSLLFSLGYSSEEPINVFRPHAKTKHGQRCHQQEKRASYPGNEREEDNAESLKYSCDHFPVGSDLQFFEIVVADIQSLW